MFTSFWIPFFFAYNLFSTLTRAKMIFTFGSRSFGCPIQSGGGSLLRVFHALFTKTGDMDLSMKVWCINLVEGWIKVLGVHT